MGTSHAFYTKLSQRQSDYGLIVFYFYYAISVLLATLSFIFLVNLFSLESLIWPDQYHVYIYYSAFYGFLLWAVQMLNNMIDAYGITVSAELFKAFQKVFAGMIILLLFICKKLNLATFFYYQYLVLFIMALCFVYVMRKSNCLPHLDWFMTIKQIKSYIEEFYVYSHPLFIYGIAVVAAGILDRWLLQKYSGSVEQGFYGLAYQIASVCFFFAAAMTPLLIRELSIAYGNNDMKLMSNLFRRYIPLLFSITAYFSCFIAFQADKITMIMGGGKYKEALLAVIIMSFYPIHQTYGQLSGSVFLATGQTGLYRNIGITFVLIGLPISYFLLASKHMGGIAAGSTGLALKMVLLQYFTVNAQLYFNTKLLNLSFWKYFLHQIVCIASLLAVAGLFTSAVDYLLGAHMHGLCRLLISGLFYTITVAVIVWYCPIIFGLRGNDIKILSDMLRQMIMNRETMIKVQI